MSAIDTLRLALYGNPPTVDYKPSREGVIKAFVEVGASLSDLASSFIVGKAYATRQLMDADLSPVADTLAVVYGDDSVNNGYYIKVGAVGSGSWVITNIALPSQFASDLGTLAGTVASYVAMLNDAVQLAKESSQSAAQAVIAAEKSADRANSVLDQTQAIRDAAAAFGSVASQIGDGQGVIVFADGKFAVVSKELFKGDPGGDASQPGTFEQVKTMAFDASIKRIRTNGRLLDGDGGAADYDRWRAPMGNLPTIAQNIWWFQAADDSRWRIAERDIHLAPMFGAMGGEGIDAGPILTVAFNAPTVRQISLGALTHYIRQRLDVAPGKILRGVNRAVSWLKLIPLPSDQTQAGATNAVRHLNDTCGGSFDYSLDCQRSGLGRGDSNRTHGVSVLALDNGTCRGTRIARVDVYNCHGYAHYTAAQAGNNSRVIDVVHEDCQAFNFQVGFETTGNVDDSYSADTYAYADPIDGGDKIPTEAIYHEYGGIKDFRRTNAKGRGTVGSAPVLIFTTDGVDLDKLVYVNPDIKATAPTGLYVEGRDGNRIKNFQMIGGSIEASGMGSLFRNVKATIRETAIVGLDGNGLEGGTGATIDFHSADIEGNRSPSISTAAFGIAAQGATMRWFGTGRIAGIGNSQSVSVNTSAITFVGGTPLMIPPQGSAGLRISDKEYVFPRSAFTADFPGDAQNPIKSWWVKIDLNQLRAGGVKDRNKTFISVQPGEFPNPGTSVKNPLYSLSTLYIDNTNVRLYVHCATDLVGWVWKVNVTEYA